MNATPQKPLLIALNNGLLITAVEALAYTADLAWSQIADPYGYPPSHAYEWTHAAALEPHLNAYAPAWIWLTLLIWAASHPTPAADYAPNWASIAAHCADYPALTPT